MSVGVDNSSMPVKNSFSVIITEREPLRHFPSQSTREKKQQEKAILAKVSRRVFPGGVRAPILADFSADNSFRVDFVDNSNVSPRTKALLSRGKESSCMSSLHSSSGQKQIRFLKPDGSFRQEQLSGKLRVKRDEAWEQWKTQMAKTKDARDILYRNTFFPNKQKIRYHTCTLPRIVPQSRPWTVEMDEKSRKTMVLENQDSEQFVDRAIVPQPSPRRFDLMQIKGLQRTDNETKTGDATCIEVRKIKSNGDFIKSNMSNHLTTLMRQPSDIGRYEIIRQRRAERPLKHENIHYRPVRVTHKYPNFIDRSHKMSPRDQKSVEAYKSYVETMRQKGIEGKNAEGLYDQDNSSASHYGYENRMLQSVIDVNTPEEMKDPITPDRKSAVQNDKNSIVIQIKSTWDDHSQERQDDERGSQGCPSNTPAPESISGRTPKAQSTSDLRTRVQDT